MPLSNATEEEIARLHRTVSQNVRAHRTARHLSQLELAQAIGMKSAAFFGNAENNTHGKHFNLEHLYKIAKALNIPLTTLINSPHRVDELLV